MNSEQKLAGILVPLFALRHKEDLGIGDTHALVQFIAWAASHRFRLIQLLPINETGSDNSPYNAISSTALDPTTLSLRPEDFEDIQPQQYERILQLYDLSDLRKGDVDYVKVKELKERLLLAGFDYFNQTATVERTNDFYTFCKRHATWLDGYTFYRTLLKLHGHERREEWPAMHRSLEKANQWLEKIGADDREQMEYYIKFYAYVQWIAFSQWKKIRAYCEARNVVLMGDVPIGINYYGADVFSCPEIFDLSWSSGAPPERVFKSDPFTEKWGQNWGFPHYRWDVLKERNYDWWRQRVRVTRELFHLFRIDHILGFYRIYSFPWRPELNREFLPLSAEEAAKRTDGRLPRFLPNDDDTPEHRMFNREQGEMLLRVLLEEAGEYSLIGEDLGVVPDYVRPSLASLGIAGFKVPLWETAWDGRLLPGGGYNRLSLATYATHDHPPLRVYWENASQDELAKLKAFAGIPQETVLFNDDVREALLLALFKSNAWLAVVMITDLLGLKDRFNMPGATASSNWTKRLQESVDTWDNSKAILEKMKSVSDFIGQGNRS